MLSRLFFRKPASSANDTNTKDSGVVLVEKTPEEKAFDGVIGSLRNKLSHPPIPLGAHDGVWQLIPRELLREILSTMDLKTLLKCRLVSRSWERVCLRATPKLLLPNACSHEQLAVILAAFPQLSELHFPANINFDRTSWVLINKSMKHPKINVSRVDNSLLLNNFQIELFQLQYHELGLPLANRCIELRPDEPTYLTNRASLYQALHMLPEALEDLTRALKLAPNSAAIHNSRGLILYNLGRLSEAITEHSESIALYPEDYVFWNNRGLAYYKLGAYPEAIEDFSNSLHRFPKNAIGYYNRGRVLCDMGKYTEAEADFKQSLELTHWSDLAGFFRCGKVLEQQGKADEAQDLFKSALEKKLEPKDAEDLHALGQMLQRLSRHEESIEAFDSALRIQPFNAEYLEARAKSMNAVGRIGQALEDKERSLWLRLSHQNSSPLQRSMS